MLKAFVRARWRRWVSIPELLFERNRKLIIARISGWGQTGPYRDRPGFGTLVEGMSGFASMNGFADREPVLPPIYLGDMTAGLYGAVGVLAALREVETNSRQGQVIDIPLLDPLFAILGPQAANYRLTKKVKQRTGSRSTNSAPRNVYRTSDGKWVCLSASTQAMAERLFRAIGRPELADDPRFATNAARLQNVLVLDSIIGDFIAGMTQADCVAYFRKLLCHSWARCMTWRTSMKIRIFMSATSLLNSLTKRWGRSQYIRFRHVYPTRQADSIASPLDLGNTRSKFYENWVTPTTRLPRW